MSKGALAKHLEESQTGFRDTPPKKKLGIIVNPIAGMGGKVGLKGTDNVLEQAIKLGAVPTSPDRAIEALKRLNPIKEMIDLFTYPDEMGEQEAKECEFNPVVLGSITSGKTTATDTINAARDMAEVPVDLILFVGGDGTAIDIYEAVTDKIPVLGIPSGVKIHSGVYAINPRSAGDLAALYLQGKHTGLQEAEVMDIDEAAFRANRVSARLYGYLNIPFERSLVQGSKVGSTVSEELAIEEIALEIVGSLQDNCFYIVGPGTTTRPIFTRLNLKKTLLGVDVLYNHEIIAADVNENDLLTLIAGKKAKIIVTVIGGQGFIFGRGSQQISPEVIKMVGRENIIVVASETKLASLHGRPLLVDSGDEAVDNMLSGYIHVITGYRRSGIYKVTSP